MKLLGHTWVAVNSVPKGNRKLLILGSILPEIMYYTSNHPFVYEEIHEGGDIVYSYLKKKKLDWADLGLGMLTHSAKTGADNFNFEENLVILGYGGEKVEELREKLTEVLGITYETAKTRAHNILELAVELRIIKENPEFVVEFNTAIADKKTRTEIKKILSDSFEKDLKRVSKSVDELLNKAKPDYFLNAEGLAKLWAELSRDFDPRFDPK
ncbi:MAG: hypothetical protein ACC618_03865, partial [Patescibacteria group bacterium]